MAADHPIMAVLVTRVLVNRVLVNQRAPEPTPGPATRASCSFGSTASGNRTG